jgi:3-hydroxyanthranilate 3,4-dioxygenase
MVIERKREPHHMDRLRWYCDNEQCKAVVNEERFHVVGLDLGQKLKPFMEAYYNSVEKRTCKKCGTIAHVPQ